MQDHQQGASHDSDRAARTPRPPARDGGRIRNRRQRPAAAQRASSERRRTRRWRRSPAARPRRCPDDDRSDPGADARRVEAREVSAVLVDSSVILDVLTVDPEWGDRSAAALAAAADAAPLVIDPIIYAEVSVRFTDHRRARSGASGRDIPPRGAALGGGFPRRQGVPSLPQGGRREVGALARLPHRRARRGRRPSPPDPPSAPRAPVLPDRRADPAVAAFVPRPPPNVGCVERGKRIDLLFVAEPTASALFARATQQSIFDETSVAVVHPEHLVAMKLFALQQIPERLAIDLEDVRALLLKGLVDSSIVSGDLVRYGLEEYRRTLGLTL